MDYIILKILNNNVVLLEKDEEQMIAIGKGLGFNKKPGDYISEFVEEVRIFYVTNEHKNKTNVDLDGIEEQLEIIINGLKEQLNVSDENYGNLLYDHVLVAVQRLKLGFALENPFNAEIKTMYSKEYDIAYEVGKLISEKVNIDFTENEVCFLALHIKSITTYTPVVDSIKEIRLLNASIKKISDIYGVSDDTKTLIHSLQKIIINNCNRSEITGEFEIFVEKNLNEYYKVSKEIIKNLEKELRIKISNSNKCLFAFDVYRFVNNM